MVMVIMTGIGGSPSIDRVVASLRFRRWGSVHAKI